MSLSTTNTITLDLSSPRIQSVRCVQGDKDSRIINIRLTNHGQPFHIDKNLEVLYKIHKPDDKGCYNDAVINNDESITITLTEQATAVAGKAESELQFIDYNTKQILSTMKFYILVEKSVLDNTKIESDYESSIIEKFLFHLKDFMNPHKTTKDQVGLGNCDNTADKDKNVFSALKWTIARKINGTLVDGTSDVTTEKWGNFRKLSLSGDVSGSLSTDGSSDVNMPVTVINDSHNHTDATLPSASPTVKGVTKLTDSISSTSTDTAATPNSVKTAYDKAVSSINTANTNLNSEIERAKKAEQTITNTINSNKPNWDDKYTRNEIDNKFSTLESNIDWKESVSTFDDIARTYPNPQDGWTVNVKDTDYTYRYSGSKWVAISANAIPKATQSVDGLLTASDKTNYDDANTKKHTHGNKSVLDGITAALVDDWNKKSNGNHTHDWSVITGKPTTFAPSAHNQDWSTITGKPTSMPASDVSEWAKASTKPSYAWSEIGNKPTTFPPSAHNQDWSTITGKPSTFPPTSHTHDTVHGNYTKNGGAQPPSYIAGEAVRFNMMNAFKGLATVGYMDTILMDTYGGGDVPYVTGLGILKQSGNPRAFIAVGAKGNTTTWSKQAELITSANIGSQSVNYASSAGSVAWGNVSGKPTIPSVGNGTVTITQNGATKGSFTMNQSGNTTIALTDNNTDTNTTYSASTGLSLSGTAFSVKYGTAAGTACQGNDSRLSNSRPASDVYAWAKASTKPSYSWSEIQSKPTTFPPSKHNHGAKDDYATYARWLLCPPTGRILVLADEGYLRSYNDAGTLENGVLCAGSANYRFKQVYITSSAISTSDRNYKKDVKPLTDKHLQFFMLLQPVSFLFKDGDSGRTHIGFISQDVEKAMEQVGLTDLDFAGFCKDKKEIIHSQMNEDGIMTEQKELVLDENGQQVYIYSLRYEEFIALNTHMIQHLYHKIDAIEQRLNCEKQ